MFGKQTESKSKCWGFRLYKFLQIILWLFFSGEALIASFLGDNDNSSTQDDPISQQFLMAKSLSVLHIKASTFHSLHFSGKHDKVCTK